MTTDNAQNHKGVVIDDPTAKVAGETIAEWTHDWTKWALGAPAGSGPLDSASYAATHYHNDGKIFFLAGGPGGQTIDVPAGKPILVPRINAFDTEGKGIETISGYYPDRGSYADEAKYVTGLVQDSIYDSYLTITKVGETTPIVDLHEGTASRYAEDSGKFALGKVTPDSWIMNYFRTFGITALDPSVKNLPYTEEVGRWAMIEGLSPGDYTINFGGAGHAVVDSVTGATIFGEGWGPQFSGHTTETLHVA